MSEIFTADSLNFDALYGSAVIKPTVTAEITVNRTYDFNGLFDDMAEGFQALHSKGMQATAAVMGLTSALVTMRPDPPAQPTQPLATATRRRHIDVE